MKKSIKVTKSRYIITYVVIIGMLFMALWILKGVRVFAYNFAMDGAQEAGTVTISAKAGKNPVNGYSALAGYRVTYTISKGNWTAFDDRFGGYFLMGNDLDVKGGCQFAYHTSGGEIWEDGAVNLGSLKDGRQIERCDVAAGTVSCSFDVESLEEMPAYIAYVYEPASSAYIHINNDMGMNAHVWHYKSLKDAPVIDNDTIDRDAPDLTSSVIPGGVTASVNGKIWSTKARIQVRAQDVESRPGGVRLYKDGAVIYHRDNPENGMVLETAYDVEENGLFQADAYDKLNNICNKTDIAISCIDRQPPVIEELKAADREYVRETKVFASAKDTNAGLHQKAYSFNGRDFGSESEWKVTANGAYTLKVRDVLGNESSKIIQISNIDREAPKITKNVVRSGRMATCEGILWSTQARISALAADNASGVRELCLMDAHGTIVDKNETTETNLKQLYLEQNKIKNGSYKMRASDMAGNTALTESFEIAFVDGEAPIIEELKTTRQKDGMVLLTVIASDAPGGIGLDDEAYSFDGGKTWQKEASFRIKENGVCRVLVRDRLHQSVSEEKEITEVSPKEKEEKPGTDKNEPDEDNKKPDQGGENPGDGKEEDGSGDKKDDNGDGTAPADDHKGDESHDGQNEERPGQGTPSLQDTDSGQGNPQPGIQGAGKNNQKAAIQNNKRTGENSLRKYPKSSVSGNGTGKTRVTKRLVVPETALEAAKEKLLSKIGSETEAGRDLSKKGRPAGRTLLFILAVLFVAGCIGLLLYLLLFCFRYSCVLYGVEETGKRQRIGRLPLREKDEEWQITVPDHKLGFQGTGRYLILFHPAFAKEEAPAFVTIHIDGKRIREKIEKEVSFRL